MVFSGSLAQNFSMDRKEADLIMRSNGWLSSQNPEFQNEVLKRSLLVSFEPGEYVYRMGDSLGGIYGLVRGNLTINTEVVREIWTAEISGISA
ncbi:hypothetical protein ACFQ3K_16035 [Brucella gallinifaecis]|uniref:Cyclic nucleotide-binding domain-containing protein n=1 Tax=Brucella gallinifaecis TaxID=215590 RepID=A0A502BMU3_9HYPH|nr:hypothetical protein [Brucella gallinifaecis]TPF74616.1 hypothetical protein FHY56_12820 [Brucella gallinifaecis]